MKQISEKHLKESLRSESYIMAEKTIKWYKHIRITVEPTMFLYMFAFMLTSVVEQAFFVRKSCLVNNNFTIEICDNLDKYPDIKKQVQITTTNFHMWNNIGGHIFPICLALFLGSWSDKRGRKFPLIMGLIGKLIYSLMIIVNDQQSTWPVQYIIFTATIPCALTGADVAIFASCFAYISDVSTIKNRTIRVTFLDVSYLFAMPTGVALGSFLFNEVLNKSYSQMFTINASLLVIAIIYSLLVLQWQTTDKQQSIRELGFFGLFKDFFDSKNLIESFSILFKKREMHRRMFLGIFMITMALYTFQRDEKPFLYLYTQLKYNWSIQTYSNFKTFQSSAYVLVMLSAIPMMSKFLKWRDTSIILIGCTAHAIARLIYIYAPAAWVFYLGSAVCSLGPIVGPLLRSMTSKIVPTSERGKVFALLSVCDNAVPFISGICYSQVYNATIGKTPGVFWLTFSTQCAVFMLMMIIHVVLGNRSLAVEVDKKDTLIIEESPDKEKQAIEKIKYCACTLMSSFEDSYHTYYKFFNDDNDCSINRI